MFPEHDQLQWVETLKQSISWIVVLFVFLILSLSYCPSLLVMGDHFEALISVSLLWHFLKNVCIVSWGLIWFLWSWPVPNHFWLFNHSTSPLFLFPFSVVCLMKAVVFYWTFSCKIYEITQRIKKEEKKSHSVHFLCWSRQLLISNQLWFSISVLFYTK